MDSSRSGPKMLHLRGREIPLKISRHPKARHISVRLDGRERTVRLVLPRRAALREGLAFAEYKADWLLAQLNALPARVPFEPGAVIPILGEERMVRHSPGGRGGAWLDGTTLWVSGQAEHAPRRVGDFLKDLARREAAALARVKAATIERTVRRVSVREMRTRWGSCSSDGNISFCWRLILTPSTVFDYVVAHEVAHLREMNHGRTFWTLAGHLAADMPAARRWLRERGDDLLRYG